MTSFSSLINQQNISTGFRGVQTDPTGMLDVIPAAYNMTRDNFNTNSVVSLMREIGQNNRQELESLGLEEELQDLIVSSMSSSDRRRASRNSQFKRKLRDIAIGNARAQDPEKWKTALTSEEIRQRARDQANLSREEFEKVAAAASGFDSVVGGFAGSVGASFTDPLNLGTMFFGASAGRTILKAVAIEAAVNMGAEAAAQPLIADWQKELNQEYGFSEAAVNVLSAGLMGAGATIAIKGFKPTTHFVLDQAANAKFLPPKARRAARNMANYVHIKDADPGIKTDPDSLQTHVKNVETTSRVFEEGRPVRADDIVLSTLKPKDNTDKGYFDLSDVMSKDELKRFADETTKEVNKIKEELIALSSLKRSRGERKILRAEREQLRRLLNQVREITPKPERRKGLSARNAKKEALQKGKADALQDRKIYQDKIDVINRQLEQSKIGEEAAADLSRLEQDLIPEKYADRISIIRQNAFDRSRPEVKNFEANTKELKDFGVIDEPPLNKKVVDELLEEANSDPKLNAMEQEFKEMVKADPNKTLTLEDGTQIPIKKILDDFRNDEKVIKQITACATGAVSGV